MPQVEVTVRFNLALIDVSEDLLHGQEGDGCGGKAIGTSPRRRSTTAAPRYLVHVPGKPEGVRQQVVCPRPSNRPSISAACWFALQTCGSSSSMSRCASVAEQPRQ